MTCLCRCHATSSTMTSCDVGPEQPGGNQSCTPTHTIPLDEACILGHAEPVEREYGYACRRHYGWIDRTLQEIEELCALLPAVLIPGPAGDGRSGTRVGSPAPGSVDVMAITDKRAKTPVDLRTDPDREGVRDVPDLPGSLASWARLVVEERPTTDVLTGGVSQSIRILRRERMWIARQEWLDDYAGELGELHRAVARAVGDSPWPRPVGKCPNCGTAMYPTIGIDEAHCRRCRASWTGVALARLRLIHEQEARDGAANNRHAAAPAATHRGADAGDASGHGGALGSAS